MKKKAAILKVLNINAGNTFFTLLFFVGPILTILAIDIQRDTFVSWKLPTLVWLSAGLIATPLFWKMLPKYLGKKGLFYQLVYNILTWGGIAVYLFLAGNFYFPEKETFKETVEVLGHGELAKGRNGCGDRYVDVKLFELEKQLFFPCGTDVSRYTAVSLVLQKGFLGFYIVREKIPTIQAI